MRTKITLSTPGVGLICGTSTVVYPTTDRNQQLGQLQVALERIANIQAEAERLPGVTSGNGNNPQNIQGPANIEALRLDYQLAVLTVSKHTEPSAGLVRGAVQAVFGRNTVSNSINNFHDIFGSNFGNINYSAVANSQLHYGIATEVFIEDQPLLRGTVLQDVGTETWKAGDVKLLVPNFIQNDFGDTLEKLVNSLGAYLGVDKASGWSELKGNLTGGTWAEVKSVDGYTGRADLHKNLDLIAQDPDYQDLIGKVTVQAASAELNQQAQSDFGALVALQMLSPFVFKANAVAAGSQGLLNDLWGSAWSDEYTLWQEDKTARTEGKPALNYTDMWLADRAALLKWSMARNASNVEEVRSPGAVEAVNFKDISKELTFSVANTNIGAQGLASAKRVYFGGEEADDFAAKPRRTTSTAALALTH